MKRGMAFRWENELWVTVEGSLIKSITLTSEISYYPTISLVNFSGGILVHVYKLVGGGQLKT